MFCSYCGAQIADGSNFCSYCGRQLNSYVNTGYQQTSTSDVLGTLATVMLAGGIARDLYYYNGRYYHDRYCRRPYSMIDILWHPHCGRPIPHGFTCHHHGGAIGLGGPGPGMGRGPGGPGPGMGRGPGGPGPGMGRGPGGPGPGGHGPGGHGGHGPGGR